MEKREQYYKDMDAEAKGELEKAKANNAESEKKLADLDNELSLMRKSMNADMDEAREQMISEARKEAKEIINSANSKQRFTSGPYAFFAAYPSQRNGTG